MPDFQLRDSIGYCSLRAAPLNKRDCLQGGSNYANRLELDGHWWHVHQWWTHQHHAARTTQTGSATSERWQKRPRKVCSTGSARTSPMMLTAAEHAAKARRWLRAANLPNVTEEDREQFLVHAGRFRVLAVLAAEKAAGLTDTPLQRAVAAFIMAAVQEAQGAALSRAAPLDYLNAPSRPPAPCCASLT